MAGAGDKYECANDGPTATTPPLRTSPQRNADDVDLSTTGKSCITQTSHKIIMCACTLSILNCISFQI